MNLIELIKIFRKGKEVEDFYKEQSLDSESEVVEIYMRKPFDIYSKIYFFEIEETEGAIEYEKDGQTFYNLFDFYYFQDLMSDYKKGNNKLEISDSELAKKILDYAIKDA